jgi:hypothetical protein
MGSGTVTGVRRPDVATFTLGSGTYTFDLTDPAERGILADLLEDFSRGAEAALLRGGEPVHLEGGEIRPADASAVAQVFAELSELSEEEGDMKGEECREFAGQLDAILHTQGIQAAVTYYLETDNRPSHVTLSGMDPWEWIQQLEHQAYDWEQAAAYLEDAEDVVAAGEEAVQKAEAGDWTGALAAAERACKLEARHWRGSLWSRLRDEIRRQMGRASDV